MRTVFVLLIVAAAAVAGWLYFQSQDPSVMGEVKRRGMLTVGVRVDYPPFGSRDETGAIVGFEPDLARDVAQRLGVEVSFVPVVATDRMQKLQRAEIDLVIAAMADQPERREIVWVVEPGYYASGANVLAPLGARLRSWEELEGERVCAVSGAFFNEAIATNFKARMMVYRDTEEALRALAAGECLAFAFDEAWLLSALSDPAWIDFEMPLPTAESSNWVVAVRHGESRFHNFMERTVKDWHAQGTLIGLERKWGIPASEFTQKMHELYKDGGPPESDAEAADTPPVEDGENGSDSDGDSGGDPDETLTDEQAPAISEDSKDMRAGSGGR